MTLAAVMAIVVAGCGQAATEPGSADPDPSSTTPDLPGIQAFGLTDEEFTANAEAVETSIASCMRDAGFEYVPVDVTAILDIAKWLRTEPNVSREEYKSKWGYGISTRFDNPAREVGLGPQNLRIYEDLSEADKIAYDRTLFGDDRDATFAITVDDENFTNTGGCTRKAVEEVFPPEMMSASFVNPKDVLVESDPRVVEADEKWVDCMAEDGYDYEDQDEIIEEYEERFDVVTDGEDPEQLTGAALEALKELQAEEIAIALKDLQCQLDYVDDVVREVEIELFGAPVSG